MNPVNVFYPESRNQNIEEQFSLLSTDYQKKYIDTITELRNGKRQHDHKFKKIPAQYTWISDLGGRKGGRIIYLKSDEDIIIWGIGSDHDIEDDAARSITSTNKEKDILTSSKMDVTYKFPDEEELRRYRLSSQVFAGNISDKVLEEFGLSEYQIKQVRKSDRVSLWDLYIPDKTKFKIAQLSLAAHGTVFYAQDDAHLVKYIQGDVSRLLVYLDDYQQEIVSYHSNKPLLIRGETGTGKTTILIYKAVYFAEANPDKDVILFTYNIALANLIKEAITELNDSRLTNLTVNGFFEWMKDALVVYEKPFELIEDKTDIKIYDILKECYTEKEMISLGYEKTQQFNYFIKTEIESIIQDYVLTDIEEYLRFQRIGRNRQLGERQREAVWNIYQRFLEKLSEKGLHTYKTLLKYFCDIQKSRCGDDCLSYDAIFLDEAQDMPPSVIKTITLLRKNSDSLTWIAGDYKQAIYRNSFRWSDVKLPFYGANVKILKKNYRNSFQILDAAHNMLKSFIKDAERPEHCGRQGSPIKTFHYEGDEKFKKLKGIIDYFHKDEKIDYSDIAIFTPYKPKKILEELTKLSVPCEMIKFSYKEGSDSVKISTLYSAKGLEFRVVIILDTQTKLLDEKYNDDIIMVQQAAKLLYVGMTRAYDVCCFLINDTRELGLIMDKILNPVKSIRVK